MATLSSIKKEIASLTAEGIAELQKELTVLRKKAEVREAEERAKQWRKDVSLDEVIIYRRGGKDLTGAIEAISNKGVQVRVPGSKRARTVKFHEILRKK